MTAALALAARLPAWLWLVAALAGWGWWNSHQLRAERAAAAQARAEATQEARRFEQAHAARVQEIQDAKDADLRRIGGRLAAALDRLRDRPKRPADMPEAGRAACAGATGAELSGPDAAFLAGEAARADTLRAELGACQERERAGRLKPPP